MRFNFVSASVCKASPVLGKYRASGKFFKQVSLTARKTGEGQKNFLKVTMNGCW